MDKNQIKNDVMNVVKQYLSDNGYDTSSLNLKTNLIKDYNLDSLDYLELFSTLEDKFNIKISNKMQDYEPLFSIDNLAEYILLKK